MSVLLSVPTAAHATLSTSFQISGNVGYELAGLASPGPPVTGNIMLNNIPPGALIQHVFLYTADYAPGGGFLDFSVTPPVGPVDGANNVSPFSSDPGSATTFGYKIGLNPATVVGNGNYGVSITSPVIGGNASSVPGAAMLVIYSDPLLPQSTITVNDGVFEMGTGMTANSKTTTFSQLSDPIHASGNSQLSILTFSDDPANSGEQIKFNGSVVGGPIDSNMPPGGGSGSTFDIPVVSLAGGSNTATLTSTGDFFSWHLAVLQTPVPEPSTYVMAAFALLGLGLYGWRRRQSR